MCDKSLIIQGLVVIIEANKNKTNRPPKVHLVMEHAWGNLSRHNYRLDNIKMFFPLLLSSCSYILAKEPKGNVGCKSEGASLLRARE